MTLLPPNATALERALDLVEAGRTVDPSAIAAQLDPWRCPAQLLGYLAWSLSVDVWHDAWPELKKRQVCARSFELHRLKGTLAGIRAHVALVDAAVLRVRRPSDRTYFMPARSAGERLASLATLPQLRVYPFLDRGEVRSRSFWRGARHVPTRTGFDATGWDFSSTGPSFDSTVSFADRLVPQPIGRRVLGSRDVLRKSRGEQFTGLRTTIVDHGIEREVARQQVTGGFRVLARPSRHRGWHGRGYAGQGYLQRSTAATDSYTLRLDPTAGATSVQPGAPITAVRPTRIHARRTAPAARRSLGTGRGRFIMPSHGPFLVYDQVPLLTGAALGRRQRRRAWYGVGRLGTEPYTAEVLLEVPLHRGARRGHRFYGVGHLAAADLTPVIRAIEAVRAAKAARDTILVDTTAHRPVRFSDGLRFGSFAFGEIRKAA